MTDQKRPTGLTCEQRRWNSRRRHADQRGVPAALPPGLPADREGDRARRAAARRPAPVRALAVRRAGRQPRHRAARDRGARGRRARRGPRARIVRHRRRAGRAAQHADEPLRAGPLARPDGQRARARAPTSGRRRSTRPRRSAIAPGAELFELERAAHARRAADLDRPQPGAAAARARADRAGLHAPPRCTRRSSAPATRRARADYELEARGADAPEAELLGLAPGRRSCSRRRSRSARTAGSSTSAAPCTAPTAIDSRRR